MRDLIFEAKGTPEEVFQYIDKELKNVLIDKQKEVANKIKSVKEAFEYKVKTKLEKTRREL